MIKKVDHIGIAVRSLETTLPFDTEVLKLPLLGIEEVESQKVRVAFLKAGETKLELLEPTTEESTIAQFIEKRGEHKDSTNRQFIQENIMYLTIYKNYESLSQQAASEILACVKQKPNAVLCLAAGDTPNLAYSTLTKIAERDGIDFSHCTFIGLDEWIGIPPGNEGSCHYFLRRHLFEPLRISNDKIHLFDALSADPQEECKKMDRIIIEKGGIDLMLVGIGMNGHIGFNEPGAATNGFSHVVALDDATKSVGQKYFRERTLLSSGITLGLGHMLAALKVILIANGIKKAEIIKRTLEGAVTPSVPASVIRNHENAHVMLDEEAGALLTSSKKI